MLAGLALAGACAAAEGPASSRFPPGEVASPAGPVVVEVGSAHYRERGVTLSVEIRNTTRDPLTVKREGILLAHGPLEFAVQTEVAGAPEAETRIGPEGRVSLELSFETGHALREPSQLMLRALASGERWHETTSVEIPPMPVTPER